MRRDIKSYVLRSGRVSPRQQQGLDQHLEQYALPISETPWDLTTLFQRNADLIVEIGFGMGASLLTMARNEPEMNFIGIEVHRAGIGRLSADLQSEGLSNVRIAPFDAKIVFDTCLPDQSLSGIQIFFPDPWPKKRHHKRRLIQHDFVVQLIRKLKPGGFIHCATDWQDYAEQMHRVLSSIPELINQSPNGDYSERPSRRPITKFEQRGTKLGHGVWDLLFTHKP